MPDDSLRFQLATYNLDKAWAKHIPSLGTAFSEIANAPEDQFLVIDIISNSNPESDFAVLVSIAKGDARKPPTNMSCWLAFSNRVTWCDAGRRAGFPMVEAAIKRRLDKSVAVRAARYAFGKKDEQVEALSGAALAFGAMLVIDQATARASSGRKVTLRPTYDKYLSVPDAADAHALVLVRKYPWTPLRTVEHVFDGTAAATADKAWYPDLALLLATKHPCVRAWTGTTPNPMLPRTPAPPPASQAAQPPKATGHYANVQVPASGQPANRPTWSAASRKDLFGPPKFAFDDVEIIGFRVDLPNTPRVMDALRKIIEPLNFHLDIAGGLYADDFRYEVATPCLAIELLRYRKMSLTKNWPPVRKLDYQSQHELLLRVLVGRVDDDTAQARAAAVHVPAIFVDNPWSKALGRAVQGFDKRLSSFCAPNASGDSVALSMDGKSIGRRPQEVPLMQVDRVSLVDRVGAPSRPEDDVIRINYARGVDLTDRDFDNVDLRGVAGQMIMTSGPWRQSDFDAAEFRRSFARPVVARGFDGFRSLQVSPVDSTDDIKDTGCAWVSGTVRVTNLRYLFPTGLATLTLPHCEGAPKAWKKLRRLMPNGTMSFATGSWYRAQCSMLLSIDDGLRW